MRAAHTGTGTCSQQSNSSAFARPGPQSLSGWKRPTRAPYIRQTASACFRQPKRSIQNVIESVCVVQTGLAGSARSSCDPIGPSLLARSLGSRSDKTSASTPAQPPQSASCTSSTAPQHHPRNSRGQSIGLFVTRERVPSPSANGSMEAYFFAKFPEAVALPLITHRGIKSLRRRRGY